MLHGFSLDGVNLGQLGAPVTVEQCVKDTGMPAADCQRLLLELIDVPNGYAIVARSALMVYGTYKCAALLQAEGVPMVVGTPACAWAVQKIGDGLDYLFTRLFSDQAPTIRTLRFGSEGVFWRKISSASELEPGETFFSKGSYGLPYSWAELNLAILKQDGQAARVALIPCARLPYTGERTSCRDSDGVRRPTRVTAPFFLPAFYKKADQFPDLPPPGAGGRPQIMNVGPLALIAAQPGAQYPAGSITAYDPAIAAYRVAAPLGLSGTATYREVATVASKPAGAALVPLPTYQAQTGTRPWYRSWKVWAGVGLGAAAVGGGALALRRRRR